MTEDEAASPARAGATGGAWTPLLPIPLPDDFPPSDGTGPMPLEIERKFLVADDAWKREVVTSEYIRTA